MAVKNPHVLDSVHEEDKRHSLGCGIVVVFLQQVNREKWARSKQATPNRNKQLGGLVDVFCIY